MSDLACRSLEVTDYKRVPCQSALWWGGGGGGGANMLKGILWKMWYKSWLWLVHVCKSHLQLKTFPISPSTSSFCVQVTGQHLKIFPHGRLDVSCPRGHKHVLWPFTFHLSPHKCNQLICESKLIFVPNLKGFSRGSWGILTFDIDICPSNSN